VSTGEPRDTAPAPESAGGQRPENPGPAADPNPRAQALQRVGRRSRQRPAPGPAPADFPSTGARPIVPPGPAAKPRRSPGTAGRAGVVPGRSASGRTPSGVPAADADGAAGGRDHGRRLLGRLMNSESPPTQAFSIVDRLVGSPYANPTIQVGTQDANARKTLEFALDLAEAMFRYGAGALEAETSIIAVTASLGLRNVEVDITNQSIHLNYAPHDAVPMSLLRVVRSRTNNYAGLALVHQLVTDIVADGVTRREAAERLHSIVRRPKPFPRWMVTAAGGAFAAMFVLFIGGTWQGAVTAFLSSLVVSQVAKLAGRWRIPEFFATAAGAFVVTGIALLLWVLSVPISPAMVVAGGIILLLPSSRFVSSVQDAINGFPVTAAGRFFSALIIYAALVAGIMTALVLGTLAGAPELNVASIEAVPYPGWLLTVLMVLAVIFGAVSEQTARRMLVPTAGVALLGYLVYLGVQALGVGDRLAPALAAVAIGAAGRWVALRMGAPQLVVAVPAIVFLLPGLMIFRAMYGIAIQPEDVTTGLVQMFNAFSIILAIAGGVVFGDTLARPLTRGWHGNERRRIRRR